MASAASFARDRGYCRLCAFNGQAATLQASGVRLFAGVPAASTTVAQDHGDGVHCDRAGWPNCLVTLQENNAVAKLDIASATFTDIVPLGLKDFSKLRADFSDRDGVSGTTATNLKTGGPVFGLYKPDAVASYTVAGKTYYVTANEGDDRDDFVSPAETIRVGQALRSRQYQVSQRGCAEGQWTALVA